MKWLAALGLAVLLTTACGGHPSSSAWVSPKPSSVSSAPPTTVVLSPSTTASPASATPSPELPAVGLKAQCRLPVYWSDSNTSVPTHAGFLTFPGGRVAEDASAPQPGPRGSYLPPSFFYDRAYAKWIFATRDQVSPDGREFAFGEGEPIGPNTSGKLHVVDVATGLDRVIYSSTFAPRVVQFTAAGVYFSAQGDGADGGLWLIAPQGGQPRLISSRILYPIVANGAAWGLAFNSADPNPSPGGMYGPENTILRFDLTTGSSSAWWYQPGSNIQLFDGDYSGDLFVETYRNGVDGTAFNWLLDSHGTAHRLGPGMLGDLAAIDPNGIWFDGAQSGSASALWLFTDGQAQMVASFRVAIVRIAGGCIPGP